ncbi:hypothetical protein GCM10023214_65230 [Amycolatopsis dongchuanensis]|uniref:Uncharacterized protein n=1 Tax=Amycolatopsis dongchuanensis TaxID=1070866 RepID=A0ABP8VGK8_9PSEU
MNLRDEATLFPTPTASRAGSNGSPGGPRRPSLDTLARRWLPTLTVAEAMQEPPNGPSSSGTPGLTATANNLLPTPLACGNRKSRDAILRTHCGPGLEQAVEMILGTMPRELTTWTEAPRSWTGATTPPPSDDGN